jgi:nitrite reductase/ring-hydroxylating ferredoxin subunit
MSMDFITGLLGCPLHGWEFDLETGKTIFAPDKVSIRNYDIKEDGYIALILRKEPQSVKEISL